MQDWLNPTTRRKKTIQAFKDSVENTDDEELSKPMNVCDLDDTLAEFCRQIQAMRGQVFEANCQAAGACFNEVFYYQPSMFSMSNNQFARKTVEDFYRFTEPTACLAQRSERTAEIAAQNGVLVQKCAVTHLQKFKDMLGYAREQAGSLVRAAYFAAMVILNAVSLMAFGADPGAADSAIRAMGMYFELMFEEIGKTMMAFLNMIMDSLLGTPFGIFVEDLVHDMCILVNMIIESVYIGMVCKIKVWIVDILDDIIGFFSSLWISTPGLTNMKKLLQAMSCDPEDLLSSCVRVKPLGPTPLPRIDAATRCWSTYVNSLGDASSLSCSAADSCVQYDSGNAMERNGLVACDDCQLQPLQDFQRYGCDVVRKQCKCNVQSISRTACINHAQCQSPEAQCDMLDNVFSPTSFGTTPCASCAGTAAMCIDAKGGARCACPTRGGSLHSCSINDVSKAVVPDPTALCLLTLGTSTVDTASHSVDYALRYADLAAAPCSMLATAQTFCYTVYRSSWQVSTFVVGLARLDVGRRRLLEEKHMADATATVAGVLHIAAHDLERVAALPWDMVVDDGCRLIGPLGSLSATTNLSVSDHLLYKQCVRWRAIGDDVRRAFNLTVPDTFLLSMRDLSAAVSDPAVIIAFARHPEMFVYASMHSEMAAPVRAFMRSMRIWTVHAVTFLLEHSRWLSDQQDSSHQSPMHTNDTNASDTNATDTHSTTTDARAGMRVHTSHSLRLELMRAAPISATPDHIAENLVDNVMQSTVDVEGLSDLNQDVSEIPSLTEYFQHEIGDFEYDFGDFAHELLDGAEGNDTLSLHVVADDQFFGVSADTESRRLLSVKNSPESIHTNSFQDNLDAVKGYTAQLALGDGATTLLGGSIGNAFADGPLAFPGAPATMESTFECAPVWNTGVMIRESLELITTYFQSKTRDRPHVERGVFLSMPTFASAYRDATANGRPLSEDATSGSQAGNMGRFLFQTLGGLDSDYIRDIVAAVPNFFQRVTKCDIDTVMQCSAFRYSILTSTIVVGFIFYVAGIIISGIGVPYTWFVIALVYVPSVMFYSMGYSPFCAPMVPTCIGEEIIATFDTLLPMHIQWPHALEQSANCMDDEKITASECVVSCNTHPFNFRGWSEPVAWAVCELSPQACAAVFHWLDTQSFADTDDNILYDIKSALWRSHAIITQADPDTITAYRMCATFTSWRAIPMAVGLVSTFYIIPVVATIPIHLILASTRPVMTAIFMSHMHVREPSTSTED